MPNIIFNIVYKIRYSEPCCNMTSHPRTGGIVGPCLYKVGMGLWDFGDIE